MRDGGPPALVIVRGNSASGKSTVAEQIRRRRGRRDVAIVGQDYLRRIVLRERDVAGGANIGLIGTVARYALGHGYHTIVEGIFYSGHYGEMLTGLIRDHRGPGFCYYLDVPFEETLRRHATKAEALTYGEPEMRGWYTERDVLGDGDRVIGASSSLAETVERIMTETGLDTRPA
jgi:predicted kinase